MTVPPLFLKLSVYDYYFFIHSFIDGHLDYFQVLAVVINAPVWVSFTHYNDFIMLLYIKIYIITR